MSQIKRRVQNQTYKSVDGFANDFRQMFENARIFNEEGSWVWNDALALERELAELWANFVVGSGLAGAPPAAQVPQSQQPSTAGVSTPATDASADASAGPSKITLKFGKKKAPQPAPSEDDDDDEGSASDSDDD